MRRFYIALVVVLLLALFLTGCQGTAEFLMPTKGDNPANFSGAAQGYGFGQDLQLDIAATCKLIKTNSEIELITDIFGSFNGKIERMEAGAIPSEVELAPLVP